MATATLILLLFSAGVSWVLAFGEAKGYMRVAHAVDAILFSGCSWWFYFNSGLFG